MWLEARDARLELMDVERPPRAEIAEALAFLRFVNAWLGGTRAVLRCLRDMAVPDRAVIVDVATGAADILEAVEREFSCTAIGVDRSADVLACASRAVHRVRADARWLPFRRVDVILCSEFFHHLSDADAVAMLRRFDALARHGIVVNDLLRRRRAHAWVRFFSLFTPSRLVKHDGPLSVRRAFTLEEAARLRDAAGCGWMKLAERFGHRFCLWGTRC